MIKHNKHIQHRVLQLIQENPGIDADEIAAELNVPVKSVLKATDRLIKSGRIRSE